MKIGIVGLPNAGKSSLFNALTRAGATAANYPFTTLEPNVAVVGVPDERLDRVARDDRRHAGGARDDPVPRHRRAGARRAPGRGAGQPVPGQHPRDRRDPARGARPRRRPGGPSRGPGGPAGRRGHDRDRAAVRRPRAGRAPPGARGAPGPLARQGAGGRGALAARGGGGAARRPDGAHRAGARGRPRRDGAALGAHLEARALRGQRGRGRAARAAAGAGWSTRASAAPARRR